MNGLMTVTRSTKERLPRLFKACLHAYRVSRLIFYGPQALVINQEILIPNREIVITISKIRRSPAKSGDLEALDMVC